MTKYNKLVRDRIPEIIMQCGESPKYRTLNTGEFFLQLERKLDEEVDEFHRDETLEELADVLEVVYALADAMGYTKEELYAACDEKRARRGGFAKRIFLMSKE